MSNNSRKTAVLKKKYDLQTKAKKQRIVLKNLGGVHVLNFLHRLALHFAYFCL